MKYKIIKFIYKLQKPYIPGKCVKINNEFYCIFKYEKDYFEVLVKENSKLLNSKKIEIIELETTGFNFQFANKVLIIAGGIGISAVVDFIKTYVYKTNILFVYYTNICFDINDYFTIDEIKNFHYIIWNTNTLGRPANPLLGYDTLDMKIIAAGPNSLINNLRNISKNIQLNYE